MFSLAKTALAPCPQLGNLIDAEWQSRHNKQSGPAADLAVVGGRDC